MSGKKETIFITGSNGFIGKNALEFFQTNYNILSPNHSELELLNQEDVNNFFETHKIDYVIHCASVGGNRKQDDSPDVIEKNVRMFFNLSENNKHYKKMIHLGSGAEYSKGNMPPNVKESEIGNFIPNDYYGFSKYIISKYIENSENIYCLRLFGVFGPYEDYTYKFISNSILKNFQHLPITIMQNVYFDWLYIDDLMSIINYFLTNNPTENIYNITTGATTDILSIAKIINKISDFKSEIKVVNPGLNYEYSGNNQKLITEIEEYDFIDMTTAIKKLMDYYRSKMDEIDLEIIEKDPYASKCKLTKY
jgi:UDP-glucose 4-epimerase